MLNPRKLFYTLFYLRRPPWDTRVSPPELLEFIDSHPPGRALDLGCGTGTNVIALAQHGWQATGVDFVGKAIRTARRRAHAAGVSVNLQVGDVTRLEDISGPFDLVFDLGCFHGLSAEGKQAYACQLQRLLARGGTYLLYGFWKDDGQANARSVTASVGLSPDDLSRFDSFLTLQQRRDGYDGRSRPSVWFTYTR